MRGDPWLYLSSLGIGSYLGEADAATDELVRPLGQRQCSRKARVKYGAVVRCFWGSAPAIICGVGHASHRLAYLLLWPQHAVVLRRRQALVTMAGVNQPNANGHHLQHLPLQHAQSETWGLRWHGGANLSPGGPAHERHGGQLPLVQALAELSSHGLR